MPFNISSFKENGLVYGGARPSLFSVTLNVPQGIGIDTVSYQHLTLTTKRIAKDTMLNWTTNKQTQ